MSEKEIYECFKSSTGVTDDRVVDYRFCTEFYAGVYIEGAITIHMNDNSHVIYQPPKKG